MTFWKNRTKRLCQGMLQIPESVAFILNVVFEVGQTLSGLCSIVPVPCRKQPNQVADRYIRVPGDPNKLKPRYGAGRIQQITPGCSVTDRDQTPVRVGPDTMDTESGLFGQFRKS